MDPVAPYETTLAAVAAGRAAAPDHAGRRGGGPDHGPGQSAWVRRPSGAAQPTWIAGTRAGTTPGSRAGRGLRATLSWCARIPETGRPVA